MMDLCNIFDLLYLRWPRPKLGRRRLQGGRMLVDQTVDWPAASRRNAAIGSKGDVIVLVSEPTGLARDGKMNT